MKKKIILTLALIAVMVMALSGCMETYALVRLFTDDSEKNKEQNRDAVTETSRGVMYELEETQGRYCEFDLYSSVTQNDVQITVYGARFYENIMMDDDEVMSFMDFYVGIKNLNKEDAAYVHTDYSEVRLSTGESAECSWDYSDNFETVYMPGQLQEGVISFKIEHTEIKDLAGARFTLTPLCSAEGFLLHHVFEFDFDFNHEEYEPCGDREFRDKVYNDLKMELFCFDAPYKANFLKRNDKSGGVSVTVPTVMVFNDHEMDFGVTYDIVAVAVLYEFDTDFEVEFDPRNSYILCDSSKRIDCDWTLCREDCFRFLNGKGLASYVLYFPISDKADVDFENLHFVISAPLDADTFEAIGGLISLDFEMK